jgi:hypothetical protein
MKLLIVEAGGASSYHWALHSVLDASSNETHQISEGFIVSELILYRISPQCHMKGKRRQSIWSSVL